MARTGTLKSLSSRASEATSVVDKEGKKEVG
jgi:hypothetical protein